MDHEKETDHGGVAFAGVLLFPAVAFAAGQDPSVPLLLYLVVILVTAKLMGHLAVVLGQPAVLGSSWRGPPRQPSPGRCAGTRRDRDRPGGGPLRQDRRGGPPVPSGAGVDDSRHPPCGPLLVPRGGARVAAPFALGGSSGLARPATFLADPRLPRGHPVRDERRHHGARPPGHREIPRQGGPDHPRGRGRRRRPRADHPRRHLRLHRRGGAGGGFHRGLAAGGDHPEGGRIPRGVAPPRNVDHPAALCGCGAPAGGGSTDRRLARVLLPAVPPGGGGGPGADRGGVRAGLILEPVHFRKFGERNIHYLEEGLRPLVELLAPVFFVQMGAKVDLSAFASPEALWLSLLLTIAAIVGKQLCSSGSSTGRSTGGRSGSG